MQTSSFPQRIVCLTEETTETLYLLGEQDRIVGISGYTVRPVQARKEKLKVSAFTSAKIGAILDLNPDLVLGFSDMQADIAAELIRNGVTVMVFNQRSVEEIFDMIRCLSRLVGNQTGGERLLADFQTTISVIKANSKKLSFSPKVYFEEWNDPLISGIRWVSELIEIAGGRDCFAELAVSPGAKGRIIADQDDVIQRNPDIIIGSWCGKKFQPDQIKSRPGWSAITAVKNDHIFEIKSPLILQPGPAALTDGLQELLNIISKVAVPG